MFANRNPRLSGTAVLGAFLIGAASLAWAQSPTHDFGKKEYQANCAACHGMKGKGDGPYKPYLTKSPSDLTMLAKAHDGVFPYQSVYETVDGRKEIAAHGTRDMPIWGADYLVQAAADYMDVPYDPDMYVRTRIVALTDYVYRLQAR